MNDWDSVSAPVMDQPHEEDWDSISEQIKPQGSLGSFWTGIKSQAIPGIGAALGAAGGAALGVPADIPSGGAASLALGVAGAEAGGALGQKLQEKIFGEEAMRREAAQIEANKLAGHGLAAGAGEMLPAFASPAGFEKGFGKAAVEAAAQTAEKTLGRKTLEGIGHAARSGAIMGGAADGQKQAIEGEFKPVELVTHPIEEAVKFAPVGAIPGFGVGLKGLMSKEAYEGFGGVADRILGGIGKAMPDAAVMTLTGNLYDHFAHDKPLEFSTIKDETGQSIPSFMLLNGLMGVLHAPGALAEINKAREAAGKPPLTDEQFVAKNSHLFEASQRAAMTKVQSEEALKNAAANAEQSNAPATAATLNQKADDISNKKADEVATKAIKEINETTKAETDVKEANPPAQPPEGAVPDAKEEEAQVSPVAGVVEAPGGAGVTEPTEPVEPPPVATETPPAAPEATVSPETPAPAPPQPEAIQSTEPVEPASPHIRSMKVNGEEVTADLGPEGAKKFDELTERAKGKGKGSGMAISAEKRKLHPSFMTAKEREAEQKRLASNYKGKEVSVDGRNAKVVANPFGGVSVEFEDGTRRTVSKEKIQPKIEQPNGEEGRRYMATDEQAEDDGDIRKKFGVSFSSGLNDEIEHRIQTHEDSRDPEDPDDRPMSVNDALKEIILDSDYPDTVANEFKKELQELQIKLGIVKPYTKEELSRIVVTGGKKYDFKRGDVYYAFKSWRPLEPSLSNNGIRYMATGEDADERQYSDKRAKTGIPEGTKASMAGTRKVAEEFGVEHPKKEKFRTAAELMAEAADTPHDKLKKRVLVDLYENRDNASQLDQAKVKRLIELLSLDMADLDRRAADRKTPLSERTLLAKERDAVQENLNKAFAVNDRLGHLFASIGHLRQETMAEEFRRENILKRFREAAGRDHNTAKDYSDADSVVKAHEEYMRGYSKSRGNAREIQSNDAARKAKAIRGVALQAARGKLVENEDFAESGRNSIRDVRQMMENHGIRDDRINVVYDPQPKLVIDPETGKPVKRHMAGWVDRDGKITFNARNITSDDVLIRLYNEEFAHLATDIPSVKEHLDTILKAVRKDKKLSKELDKELALYREAESSGENVDEARAKALAMLKRKNDSRSKFSKLVQAIKVKMGLGKDIDLAEKIAVDAMRNVIEGRTKENVVLGADGKRYMATEEKIGKSEPLEPDPNLTEEEFNQRIENVMRNTPDQYEALELAIVRAADTGHSGSKFIEDVHNFLKENPSFKDMTKDDIHDRVIDFLAEKFDTKAALEKRLNGSKREMSELQKLQATRRQLQKRKESLEKQIEAGQRKRKVKEDKEVPDDIKAMREEIKGLNERLDEIDPRISNEDRIKRRIAALEKRLASGNYLAETKEARHLSESEWDLKLKEDALRRQLYNKQIEKRRENRSFVKKVGDTAGDTINFARSLMTGIDLSAVLRQGIFPTIANPARSFRAFPAMFKALRSAEGQRAEMARINRRPNAPYYKEGKLFLKDPDETSPSAMEEAFMSRFTAALPKWTLVGPAVRASERAYVTFLNRLRADVFDSLVKASGKHPSEMTSQEIESIGNAANVFTGRGKVFGHEKGASTGLNLVFFSPNYVASVFNTMFGQPLYHGSAATRKAVAGEYARFLGGAALLYSLAAASLGKDDSIETDMRSSDFGKIKLGNVRVNPLGGLIQNTILLNRVIRGETKTQRGEVKSLRGNVPYGGQTTTDVLTRYGRQKLSPVLGATVSGLEGKDAMGQPTTPLKEAGKLFIPLSFRDIQEAMEDQGIPKGTALAILSIFGMGVNAYDTNRRP